MDCCARFAEQERQIFLLYYSIFPFVLLFSCHRITSITWWCFQHFRRKSTRTHAQRFKAMLFRALCHMSHGVCLCAWMCIAWNKIILCVVNRCNFFTILRRCKYCLNAISRFGSDIVMNVNVGVVLVRWQMWFTESNIRYVKEELGNQELSSGSWKEWNRTGPLTIWERNNDKIV